ncbi:MAG: 23S rRNA (uracil(1939)-C(5))-methyltransferase RlmD, partial [Elusimicrobiota bacterium]
DWQHLDYAGQLEAKEELLRDCLRRIAKIPDPPVERTVPSPAQWRYRNKVLIPFQPPSEGSDMPAAGFYAPASHRVVGFEDCPVQTELSVRIIRRVRELSARLGWSAYDEKRHQGWLRHLLVRCAADGRALAAFVTRTPDFPRKDEALAALRADFPELAGLFQCVQPERTSVALGPEWKHLWGEDRLEERVGELRLRFSPSAFFQVNTAASELLFATAAEFATEGCAKLSLLLDLYCGVGPIALWLAAHAERVVGFEESREAIADAQANARLNGIRNARFICGRVETSLGRLRKELEGRPPGSACAVLDPPRAGCADAVLKAVSGACLGRLVYASCDPATFARDAGRLNRLGWKLARARPHDLFPQTSHVEAVGLFIR